MRPTIDSLLSLLARGGIVKIERIESEIANGTAWIVTERYGAQTIHHVGSDPVRSGIVRATGNHIYID